MIILIIFSIKIKYINENKNNYINVAYSFDNIYYYITHVSMKSLMLNQNNNTFIIFHILLSKEIYNEQKPIIDKICIEHNNCKINYYQMSDQFKKFSTKGIGISRTSAIFYRLILQNLHLNETKALYFDCDTIIYKDLTEMYNFELYNKYYVGELENQPYQKYGSNLNNFINTGVMLINLENLRKDKIYDKMLKFLTKYNNSLLLLDQDAINVVCNNKNDYFPSNYISSGYCDIDSFKINQNLTNNGKKSELEPIVFHLKGYRDKPWNGIVFNSINNITCFDQIHRFYEYARKSSYYYEILEKFQIKNKNL